MKGYLQFPSLFKGTLFFAAGGFVWRAPQTSETKFEPQKISNFLESLSYPIVSQCGKMVAYLSERMLFCMDSDGGNVRQLTFSPAASSVIGFSPNGNILFTSSERQPFSKHEYILEISPYGGIAKELSQYGPAGFISFGQSATVIQRNGYGYLGCKQYQGGEAGTIWVDRKNNGDFQPFLKSKHNLLTPIIIGDVVYFLSDKKGMGNVFSKHIHQKDGPEQQTYSKDFYARHLSCHEDKLLYSAGGDIFILDTKNKKEICADIEIPDQNKSVTVFKDPVKYLSGLAVGDSGKNIAITSYGRLFEMGPGNAIITQRGEKNCIEYTLPKILSDGSIAVIKHGFDEDLIEIHPKNPIEKSALFSGKDFQIEIGRIKDVQFAPCSPCNHVAIINIKNELIVINKEAKTAKIIDKSPCGDIDGMDWSSCGRWLAYAPSPEQDKSAIKIYDAIEDKIHTVVDPEFINFSPSFSESGKFLCFLSKRIIDTNDHRAYTQPFLLSLKKDALSPFIEIHMSKEEEKPDPEDKKEDAEKKEKKQTVIDFDGIKERIEVFSIESKKLQFLSCIKGKILYTAIEKGESEDDISLNVYTYDIHLMREECILHGVLGLSISNNLEWMAYRTKAGVIVGACGTKPIEALEESNIVHIHKIRLCANQFDEWKHMFNEAWKLQKELFWREDMGKIDWDNIRNIYGKMIDRISTDVEFFAIINDMIGCLKTSHAYVFPLPKELKIQSYLGARFEYHEKTDAYQIIKIYKGDIWDTEKSSPLLRQGLNIKEGDIVYSIGGEILSKQKTPEELLLSQKGNIIQICTSQESGENKRIVPIKPIESERALIYRDWIESNRQYVLKKTNGRIGYIHIPDMDEKGLKEFFRYYGQEFNKDGLVIDARFNGGGNVSPVILKEISAKLMVIDFARNYGALNFQKAPRGPMSLIINGQAGSDGDLFANAFKYLKLGPVIGKRTWGGVVGICPRYPFINHCSTSQPEFACWFIDKGWGVENYGVDPDIEIDILPQEYAKNIDPQLDRAIEEVLKIADSPENQEKQKNLLPKL